MSGPTLPRHPFGATGLEVSPLGIGATDSVEVITYLLDAGANLIDTAQCYGEHEALLGRTVSHRRHEFILVSKCGHHDVLPDGRMRSRRISMADVDGALARLRTDRLDVMLLHSYDRDLLEEGEAVAVLAAAKRAGKIRLAGYSGDNETAALAASLPDMDVIETSISIADQRAIDLVLPVCRRRGIGVIAKRPTASGAYRLLDAPPETYAASGSRPYVERLKAMGVGPSALGFGDSPGAWPEIALRFNLGVAGLHTSIVATKRLAHARANVAAARKGPLPAAAFDALREAFRRAEAASGGTWTGQN